MVQAFYEISWLLIISALVGGVALRLRQPLIVAFIAVGILAGPAGVGLVSAHVEIELLAQIGITILLFLVGLKLDVHLVKNLGPVALATGLGQLTFTITFGFLITLALGFDPITALYIAVALTFSSTIIIVKLLSDKGEIDSLHGRIAMGFLIVQDIAVVVAIALLGGVGAGAGEGDLLSSALIMALKTVLALTGVGLLMRYVFPRLLHVLARSRELLVLSAIAWGTALASLGDMFGFSMEVGAFLAGFALASSQYREAISSRLVSLRDFLLLFFFIDLGARLDLSALGAELPAAAILSVFVLVGNPLIVLCIMAYMGYRKRTGFLAGLTVAQISEFSIIFVAMGISLGHIGREALGLVTLVGLVTIALSTYMILYSHVIYRAIEPWLGVFERTRPFRELNTADDDSGGADVIVLGMGRYGRQLAADLGDAGLDVVGVDFDPEAVRAARRHGYTAYFGDAEDPEFAQALPLERARYAISTIPSLEANLRLLNALRESRFAGTLSITAYDKPSVEALTEAGADRVFQPHVDAAAHAARAIADELGAARA